MMARTIAVALAGALLGASSASTAFAQLDPPTNGMRETPVRTHAITDARVVVRPGTVLERATVVVRDGLIAAVGADVDVPAGARVWPGDGLTVYAGLIEAAHLTDTGARPETDRRHWNELVHPEVSVAEQELPVEGARAALRALGFTAAAIYPSHGSFRGSGAVVSLDAEVSARRTYVARGPMAMTMARAGSWSDYPNSSMGSIALLRQVLLDAQWHAAALRVHAAHSAGVEPPPPSPTLEALAPVLGGAQAVLFDVPTELDALRAARIAQEFGLRLMLLGSGMEFRRLDDIVALDVPIVVPLDFPDAPDTELLHVAEATTLRELMTWEQAPTNPRRLVDAGAVIALTTHGLDDPAELAARVRTAIRHGLAFDAALAALTTAPAEMLGLGHVLGTVEVGKIANLAVVEGTLFDEDATMRAVWIGGAPHEIDAAPRYRERLSGTLRASDGTVLAIEIDPGPPSLTLRAAPVPAAPAAEEPEADARPEGREHRARSTKLVADQLTAVVDAEAFGGAGWVRLAGVFADGAIVGTGLRDDGHRFTFTATLDPMPEEAPDDDAAPAPAPARHDDGISGRWAVVMNVPGRDAPVAATLELDVDADGAIAGSFTALDRVAPLEDAALDPAEGVVRFTMTASGAVTKATARLTPDGLDGTLESARGRTPFTATRLPGDEADVFEPPPNELLVPLGAYGRAAPPVAEDVLVYNATIWTSGPEGVLEQADLLVQDGRIVAVGRDLAPRRPGTRLIDATGKHVTPGLIDCHSHTGVSGSVNEGGQTNTAEVRIGDVLDPDDVGWYRQLAGGLTAANVLHGSANPIGGQNAVVKLRWGGGVDALRIDDAPGGIKFALGENVKRSAGRYPDTRMGVETFIRDAFTAAVAYRDAWDRYLALPETIRARTVPPRRDLELDALVEIIAGERLVHCHSYRQDEILMLIRVAEDFGFTIGTFQHVLEGYKVADAIARHGAGASSFSDWWQYKMEVMDAIPHNGALMTAVGVNVSFNSDSGELARRMNTEASKAVRYGGLEPAEALELVTINPAVQLGVGHRIGSLEPGKDADFAIWSGDPLSTYSRCEQTWVDGACHFTLEEDLVLRERTEQERRRILTKVGRQAFGRGGGEGAGRGADVGRGSGRRGGRGRPSLEQELDGGVLDARAMRWLDEMERRGRDAAEHAAGDCGCDEVAELVRRWQEEAGR